MKKIGIIIRHELTNLFTSKSFLFTVFGLPLISALIFGVASALSQNAQASQSMSALLSAPDVEAVDGYVDHAGLIQVFPAYLPADALRSYPDEASARLAMDAEEIRGYYVVPVDYVLTGKVDYIRNDFNPLGALNGTWIFEQVLDINLLGGDAQLAERVQNPLHVEVKVLAPEPQRDEDNPLTFFLPYGVTLLFYIVIFGAASLLLSSITREKENRVLEILMLGATPQQLLSGKIIGLGLAGLIQAMIWMGMSFGLLRLSGQAFSVPVSFQLPPSFLAWGILFFVLGYTIYASLMAGVGALVPNLREASQATFVVIFPMLIPLFLINVLIEEPHGVTSVLLSLFPLTSPVVMMTRLSSGGVAWWQPILAVILLIATDYLIVRSVAGMFRSQVLLTGQGFSLKVFVKSLLGQV